MEIKKIHTYKNLALGKNDAQPVTEEMILDYINRIISSSITSQEKEGKAEKGNIVTIDFEGFIDDVAFEGGKASNYDLELGSGSFIPGFEDQLIGSEKGQSIDVIVTFPEDYPAEHLKGKKAKFACFVHAVKEKIVPTLNDEFAVKQGFENVSSFKEAVRNFLMQQAQVEANNAYMDKLCAYLADNSEIEFNNEEITSRVNNVLDYYEKNMAQYGMNLEQYLQMSNMTKENFIKQIEPDAIKSLKIDEIFAYIAREEKFEVTKEDFDKEAALFKTQYHLDDNKLAEFVKMYEENIKAECLRRKIAEFLFVNNN